METIREISWQDLTGNKYNRGLHGAMLSDHGLLVTQRIREVGAKHKEIYYVKFDREYAISWLRVKICRPLGGVGIESLKSLLDEAWDEYTNKGDIED